MSRRKIRVRRTWAEATYYWLRGDANRKRIDAIRAETARWAAFNAREAETAAGADRRTARRAS